MGTNYEDCPEKGVNGLNILVSKSLDLTRQFKWQATIDKNRVLSSKRLEIYNQAMSKVSRLETDLATLKKITDPRVKLSKTQVTLNASQLAQRSPIILQDSQNMMDTLFYVFRESIEQTNRDKEYFLSRLRTMNEIGEQLGDYLRELNYTTRNCNTLSKVTDLACQHLNFLFPKNK
jgi:L-2-hydroxyglutarate oxidase LhgO